MPAPKNKTRISLDVTPPEKKWLDTIQRDGHHPTFIDAIRKSMRLYESVLCVQKQGGKVVFQTKDGKQETLRII